MQFNRLRLIKFYDERVAGRGSDVSAITALLGEDLLMGLFAHYWTSIAKGKLELLADPCTPGKVSGQRLDGWLLCEQGRHKFLYQVEIKNWSAYSWGEEPLSVSASTQELAEYGRAQWEYYFGGSTIPHKGVAKVLLPMKKPERYKQLPQIPLSCFWLYIAKKVGEPFTRHQFPDGKHVHVFSASAYLRMLATDHIEINMPRYERRLGLLKTLH